MTSEEMAEFSMNRREFPEDWENKELQEIAKVIDSCHKTPKYSTDGVAMLRVTNIKEGYLDLSDCLKVTKEVLY